MHALKCPEAGGRWAFTCMHVRGQRPAEAEAGVIGRDRKPRQACKDDPDKVPHEGKREHRRLMHTA
eukprot:365563-Chlamydomonas_euryale.AAC.8